MKTPFGKTPGQRPRADGGNTGVSANMMKKKKSHKKQKNNVGPSKPIAQPRRNIVGCRITHQWKEDSKVSQWKGTVLDQVPVNPSLYLIKYDGFDCIYGLELHKDERVQGLEVLPDRVAPARVSDSQLAETMIGKAVEHMFEQDEGPKEEWRGMVLARAPIMNTWFYITYEKDPMTRPQRRESLGKWWIALLVNKWNMPKRMAAKGLAWLSIRLKPNPLCISSNLMTTFTSTSTI
ncbi:unnamed protein product [Coregonus sp. 'balchen']|nr:unnamed protein product [Coregonus sp. 'balchen']